VDHRVLFTRVRTTSARHRRLSLLLVAAFVLALGWLVAPHPVPLYDGVGMPDEPYRYVVPPSGYRSTPPVSEARTEVDLQGGVTCCELEARSAEQGPQVAVYVPRGGLRAAGNGALTLIAQPVAPPAVPAPVKKGKYEGNVYRVTARGPSGDAQLTPDGSRATLQLRALNGNSPGPKVWYRPNESVPWRQLPTGKVGFDIYESQFIGAGDYVLVRGPGGSGSTVTVLLGILAVPALLIVALIALRLRSGPPADEDDEDLENEDGDPVDADRPDGGAADAGDRDAADAGDRDAAAAGDRGAVAGEAAPGEGTPSDAEPDDPTPPRRGS
jgi:hypothetical protein